MSVLTKHKGDCQMVFGRKDPTCPRCKELLAGSPPRAGWQKRYFATKKKDEESRAREIEEHYRPGGEHARGLCGPVCTRFDW